jgi:hypothetical protein
VAACSREPVVDINPNASLHDRSITMPPSKVVKPAALCALVRTVTIRSWSR